MPCRLSFLKTYSAGPSDPPGVGAGKINLGDQRLGLLGHALVGADRLAVPFPLTAALVYQPGARQRNPLLTEGPDKLPIPVAVAIALGRTLAFVERPRPPSAACNSASTIASMKART